MTALGGAVCSGSRAHLPNNARGRRSILRSPHGGLEVTDSLRVQEEEQQPANHLMGGAACWWRERERGGEREREKRKGALPGACVLGVWRHGWVGSLVGRN